MEYNRTIIKKQFNLFLYFTASIVNLTSFTCGVAFAWTSPVTLKLQTESENPLDHLLTLDEISWVASLLALGAATGPFVGGYLADKIGRKRSLIFSTIPTIISFLVLAFVSNLYAYYAARFVLGLTGIGIPLTIVPMYIGEVAEVHNRGTLGGFTILYVTSGFLFSFSIGPFTSVRWFSLSCVIAPVVFLLVFIIFIPESPSYLIMKGKNGAARKSLQKLRCGDIEKELLDIEEFVKKSLEAKKGISDILKARNLSKALCVSMGLMVIQQLTAATIVTFYLQFIFKSAGSNLSPAIAAIIIGATEVSGTLASAIIVDRLGRRPLLLASTIMTSLSLLVLSIYFYLQVNIDVSEISWLPVVTLVIFTLAYAFGIGPLPQTVLSEIFPPHVKSVASCLTVASCFTFSFATAKIFPLLVSAVDNWFGFLVFAIANSAGVIFIWRLLPETKGKTLAKILESFE